jgi:hypothetical protein
MKSEYAETYCSFMAELAVWSSSRTSDKSWGKHQFVIRGIVGPCCLFLEIRSAAPPYCVCSIVAHHGRRVP